MKVLPATVTSALLLLLSQTVSAGFIEDEWEWMIRRDFKEGCVTRAHQYLVISGLNGRHEGAWLVESCEGLFEYGSSYSPDAVPPGGKRISVERLRKLPPLTPEQIKKAYF
ncbi:hypothetical protein PSm6_43650 [Pseudomonas solani]|nr:hypothetical protein [Pseudomonas solani]EQM72133.1 hypothetical protein L682_00625 [Pseudomonas alcaligenes OT 69]MDN4146051.1 hypothetical protein [Pseudomonas tohonis]BCD87958.1 hypothetical protein PSm6_43650 [Pseudomonas solani]